MISDENIKTVRGYIDEIYAIELLEYHNMNHLSGDAKTRSEVKQELLEICRKILKG